MAPAPIVDQGASSGLAKIAAVLLLFMGAITTLAGVFFLLGAAILKNLGDQTGVSGLGDVFGGVLAVTAIIVLVVGVLEILGAIGVLRGSAWGRILGLIYGVLGLLLGVAAVMGPRAGDSGVQGGSAGGVILVGVYGFITVVLAVAWKGSTT